MKKNEKPAERYEEEITVRVTKAHKEVLLKEAKKQKKLVTPQLGVVFWCN